MPGQWLCDVAHPVSFILVTDLGAVGKASSLRRVVLHSLYVHWSRQEVTEISVFHLAFSRLFLRICASESSGEFKVLVKCGYFCSSGSTGQYFTPCKFFFIKDISETYLSNSSHCYGISFSSAMQLFQCCSTDLQFCSSFFTSHF